MALATLTIDIEARLASFEQNMDKASRIAEKNAEHMRASYARLASTAASLGGVLAGAFAGFSITEFVKRNADALDALNDVKDATGSTIENISALEQVALRTGGSLETVSGVLLKVNKVLAAADPKSPMAQALASIGLSAAELRKLDPSDATLKIAQALSGYADDGQKARLMQDLLGKSTKDLASFLKDLAERGKGVATTTDEQAQAAERFNQQLLELKTNATNAGRDLVANLLPALNALFENYKDNGLKGVLGLTKVKEELAELQGLRLKVAETAAAMKLAEMNVVKLMVSPSGYKADLDARKAEYADALARAIAAKQAFYRLSDGAGAGRGVVNPDPVRPSVPELPSRRSEAEQQAEQTRYENLLKKVKERLDLANAELATGEKLTESERLRLDVMAELSSAKMTEPHKAAIRAMLERAVAAGALRDAQSEGIKLSHQETAAAAAQAQALDVQNIALREQLAELGLTERQVTALKNARLEAVIASKEEQLQILKSMGLGDVEARQLQLLIDKLREQLGLKRELAAQGDAKARSPQAGVDQAIKDYLDSNERRGDLVNRSVRSIQDALENDLVSSLKTGELKISNFIDVVISEFLRLQIVKPLMSQLLGGDSGDGGLLGSALSALFSAKGNAFDQGGRITPFASGGVFSSPTMFTFGAGRLGVMGEAGPEAVMPLERGSDGRLGVVARGAGQGQSVNVTTTINIQAGVSRSEVAALIPQLEEGIRASVFRALRRPGAVSSY